jgi:hypothetical protein
VCVVVLAGLLGAACSGSNADALGHQACVHVASSLKLYAKAGRTGDGALASKDRAAALAELRQAVSPAALAGSEDGDWQALAATVSESARVPEADLITALSAQCAATLSSS